MSLRIDILLAKRLSSGGLAKKSTTGPFHAMWSDSSLEEFDWVAKLPQYLLVGVQATERDLECCFATDKAWVGGLPIQNTTFLTHAGIAIVGIPLAHMHPLHLRRHFSMDLAQWWRRAVELW